MFKYCRGSVSTNTIFNNQPPKPGVLVVNFPVYTDVQFSKVVVVRDLELLSFESHCKEVGMDSQYPG